MGLRLNAAIADSIITTTKEKTDKEISHDTANALNTLSEIFDKKEIKEKQEYVNILSQVGYSLIGDIAGHKENELNKKAEKARKENNSILAEKYEKEAKKWSESGTNRIAMHGIMGALVSKEAGAGMTKGLVCELPPIDSGYRGEIHAIISNVSTSSQTIHKDTRVGQLVITPVVIADFVLDLGNERGTGAFGSTGE